MAINKYTTRAIKEAPLAGGLISMPGVRSTNPVVQAQIDAAQKRREEEEREAARMEAERRAAEARQAVGAGLPRASSNAGVRTAVAGLGASAPEVTPTSARLKSTNPTVQAALDRKYAAEDAAYAAWDSQRKARQEAQAEEIKAAGGYYATLPKKEDFAAFSSARGDVNDPTYRYVNNENNYRESAEGKRNLTNDRRKLQFLTADEVKIYNYLYNKDAYGFGQRLAQDYLYSLSTELDRRQAEDEEKKNREFAQEHPIAASAVSRPDSVIGGVSAAVDLGLQGAKKLITGEDINYNSRYQQFGRRAEDVIGEVSENIESPVGRFFYEVGMSAADSLAAGLLGQTASGVMLGLSAGASAARDAASRGASDAQALIQGAAAGIAEGLFEWLSIGKFKALKDVPVTGVKSVIGNVVKQMGINASEEALTEAANIITDRINMGELSNYRTAVASYMAQGMSEDEAKNKASRDEMGQVGLAALSGAAMGGAFGVIGSVQSGIKNFAAGDAVRRQGIEQDVLDTGSAQVRGTESRMLADRLKEKQEAGGVLGRTEIGALARETALQEERNRDALGNDLPMFEEAGAAVRASAAALKRAGGVMGREVRFFRDVADVGGYAENGVVWLNVDARDPMAQVFAHELTHTAENAGVYAELRQMALGKMDAGELSAAIEKKKKTYRDFAAKTDRLVRELDDAGAEAELVADYAAGLFSDEAAIGEFAKRNRNAAVRVYDRLREWAASVRGDEEKAALAKAQRVYAQALRKTSGDARGERQYDLVGKTSDGIEIYETSNETKKLSYRERMRKFADLMQGQFRGRTAKFTKDGNVYYARFAGDDLEKNIWGDKKSDNKGYRAKINTGADGTIFELVENADYNGSSAEKGKNSAAHRGVSEWDYFIKTVQIDGTLFDLVANVRNKPDGEYVYSIQLRQSKRKESAPLPAPAVHRNMQSDYAFDRVLTDSSDNSIPQDGADGNSLAQDVTKMSHSGRRYSIAGEEQTEPEPNAEIASPGEETPQIAEVGQDAVSEAAQEEATEEDGPVQKPVQTEQEQHERKESEYWYMIDRMMERAANKDSFGDAYSGVSGDIGALLRREADSVNMSKTTEAGRAFAADGSMAEKGVTREMLNSRAAQHLEELEFSARKTIGFALGMTYWADRAETDAAVERLVTQYLWNGQYAISEADAQRKTNEAFDALFADAVVKNRAFYEKYGNIGNAIAKYVGFERKDAKKKYHEFKRSGALEGYTIDEKSIADVYKILQEQAAELFPDREGTEVKLERMLQIASSVEQVGARLERMETEAGYLNEVMRAKVDFANAINDTLREAELVRRYAEDKRTRAEEMEAVPTDPMDLVEVARKVKDLKREADRLADKYLFTDADKAVIDRLLRGELKPSEVVSPNKAGILAVYEKRAEVEAADQVIRRYNARRRERQDALADTSMGNIDLTKDKSTGIAYSTNTMERNVADVFKNKDAAKAVRENFFDNVHRASAAMVRAQNALNERVAALKISQKAAKGNRDSEAYVIQLMGEAQDSLAQYKKKVGREPEQINGRTKDDWDGVIADIKKANPNMDWAKVDAAIGDFRKIYNDLFEQMNLVRVTNGYAPIDYRRGYFPHFQKNEPDTIFGKLLAGLGVEAEVTPLPTSINGLTSGFKPGIKWTSFSQERKGFATDYDVIEGFKRYTRGALHVIYQTENIQKLRALERRIRYATTDDGMKERIKAKQAELDADATKSEDEKLAEMESLWATGRFTLSKFCNELSEYTNLLAGKKSKHDRPMEDDWNRFWYNVSNAVTKRLGANMVSANIGSALTNFIPLQQGYAQLGARRLMTGMWNTVKAIAMKDDFAVQSNFLTNRRGSTEIGSTTADKISKVAGWMMETVDGLTSETLVRARYAQNVKAGLSQEAAMDEADRWAAKVMGDRSMGSMPTIFHRKNFAVKAFTQFQLEVANNVGYLFKDMPRDAAEKGKGELAKLIAKYVLSAFLFNELYEFFFGRRPGLDPLSWVNEAAGDFAGYEVPNLVELGINFAQGEASWDDFRTEREGIYSAAANLFKNVAEQTPFVGGILPMFVDDVDGRLPISSAMPNIMNIGKAFDKDRAKQDRMEMLYKEISKPLFYLAMPMGGGQLKKAIEGIAAVVQGGSYTYNAQGEKTLQYPIYQDTAAETVSAYARAVTLGKSSFGTAQDWVDSGFDSFSAKETAIYRGLLNVGLSSREAYAAMRELGAVKKTDEQSAAELKRKALREMDMSEDAKAVIYYGMLATEKEQALLDAFAAENFRTARAAMLLNDMRDAKTTAEERKLLADARGLGDVEKVMIYREKISTAWDDEIATMHEAGFMFDDFLEAQNMLAEIEARVSAKSIEKEEEKESDPMADARRLLTVGGVSKMNEEEEKKKAKTDRDEAEERKLQRDNDFIDWAIGHGYDLNKRWVMMDCFGVSTEAKKDNQKKKFGITLPTMPEIKLPEIKMPSLPQINLPGFGE